MTTPSWDYHKHTSLSSRTIPHYVQLVNSQFAHSRGSYVEGRGRDLEHTHSREGREETSGHGKADMAKLYHTSGLPEVKFRFPNPIRP